MIRFIEICPLTVLLFGLEGHRHLIPFFFKSKKQNKNYLRNFYSIKLISNHVDDYYYSFLNHLILF